jgi:16S rRNA (cytosine1402-N4)-methyltransferase
MRVKGEPGKIHCSVLLDEVLRYLEPQDGKVYADGNLGMGGHSEAILERSGPGGTVIGFDWDRDALSLARKRLAGFGDRIQFVHDNFANLKMWLAKLKISAIDGLLLDLGLSSYQLDESGRGFSFQGSQPLDMRMDERGEVTAAHLVNTASQEELADIFYYYGEEKQARRIASFIIESRKEKEITRTDELVEIVQKAVPKKFRPKKIHVATKVFQGLRIAVNREFENLEKILVDGAALLNPGAVFCVISFHSIEDRLVKRAFNRDINLQVLTKRPVAPSSLECSENPRARSAKLRAAKKLRLDRGET